MIMEFRYPNLQKKYVESSNNFYIIECPNCNTQFSVTTFHRQGMAGLNGTTIEASVSDGSLAVIKACPVCGEKKYRA